MDVQLPWDIYCHAFSDIELFIILSCLRQTSGKWFLLFTPVFPGVFMGLSSLGVPVFYSASVHLCPPLILLIIAGETRARKGMGRTFSP